MNTVSTDSISKKSEKVNTSDKKTSESNGKIAKKRSKIGFSIEKSIDVSKLTGKQKRFIKMARLFSKCFTDLKIKIVNSKPDANREYHKENGSYDPVTNTITININAGKGKVDSFFDYLLNETLSHETVHYIKAHSLTDYYALVDFLQDNVYTDIQWNTLVRKRLEEYRKVRPDFTYEEAEEEVVANACQTMLNSPRVLMALAKKNLGLLEKISLRVMSFFDNLERRLGDHANYTWEARVVIAETKQRQKALQKKFIEAVRNARGDTKSRAESTKNAESVNENANGASEENVKNEIKYSIQSIPQSDINYVDIQVADIIGNNINDSDSWGRKARIYLRERFNGVVLPLGKTKGAYIRKEGINEYTNPAKAIDDEIYREKMLAATELDNLLKSGRYLGWNNDDGRHPEVIRWLNYETLFLVKDSAGNSQVLKGIIRIKRIARGDCFYDITKIENITNGNIGQSIINHAAESESDVPTASIPENSEKSKSFSKKSLENSSEEKFSLAEDTETIENYTEEEYNKFDDLYTASDAFIGEVHAYDRASFARSLSNRTTGMKEGEMRTLMILGASSRVYFFRADGYMHGEMLTSFNAHNKQMLEDIVNEYDKIDKSTKDASLWAEAVQSDERGRGRDSSVYGRRRPDFTDTLHKDSSKHDSSGYNERSGTDLRTEEEYDEIIRKLKEMYGISEGSISGDMRFALPESDSTNAEFTSNTAPSSDHDTRYSKNRKRPLLSMLEHDEISARDILATNIIEIAETKTEKKRVAEYRNKLDEQSKYLEEIDKLREKLVELNKSKGDRELNLEKMDLRDKIKALHKKVTDIDAELLKLQNLRSLRNVVKRTAEYMVEKSHLADEMYYYRKLAEKDRMHQSQLRSMRESIAEQKRKTSERRS